MRASVLLLSLGLALALLLCVVSVEAGTRTTVQGGGGVASKRRYTWKDEDAILLSVVTPETLSAHQAAQAQKQKQAPSAAGYVLHAANKAPKSPSPNGLNFTVYKYPTKQGLVNIFVGITEYPLGKFHVYPAPRPASTSASASWKNRASSDLAAVFDAKCDGTAETSVSAQHYGCQLAMNGGFFDTSDGSCLGNVYSNGEMINVASSTGQVIRANFGLTKRNNFVTGYLTPAEVHNGVDGGFEELVQGSGWLVREGRNFINDSAGIEKLGQGFLAEKAPRNALGHDVHGRLLQFEADGEEDIYLGLTLWEYSAILMQHFEVANAINMDGGGSSTTVYNGAVVDKPTCHDTPVICERAVTTISCVLP